MRRPGADASMRVPSVTYGMALLAVQRGEAASMYEALEFFAIAWAGLSSQEKAATIAWTIAERVHDNTD